MDQRYHSGEEIHRGDHVLFCGAAAVVVFVLDRDEWPEDEDEDSRSWHQAQSATGFMLLQEGGARIFLPEADEDLLFVSRGSAGSIRK